MNNEKDKHSLLSRWKDKSNKEHKGTAITKAPSNIDIPLSRGQQRLWFLQQLYPKNPFYNYCESYFFSGPLIEEYLLQSVQEVFNATDVLRTTYHEQDGAIVQKVNEGELEIKTYDLSLDGPTEKKERKNNIIHRIATQYFDLSTFPLMRIIFIKMGENEHVLSLTMHHIITDKWSMGLFRNQMADIYRSLISAKPFEDDENRLQYTDYAYWQSQQEVDQGQLSYWKSKLKGHLPILDLNTDFTRKSDPTFKGAFDKRPYNTELSTRLLALAKDLETTPYILFLSVFNVLMFRYTGQTDILIGSPFSSRTDKSLENLIGFFNETLVIRSILEGDMAFLDLVAHVRQNVLDAFSNKDISFEQLVQELNPERSSNVNPFFQVMFLYHSVPPTPIFDKELELSHSVLDIGVSKFDLTLYIEENDGSLSATFEYATDLFKASTIAGFHEHFELLLMNLVDNSAQPITKIPMLTLEEKKVFFPKKVSVTGPFDIYAGIHEIIEEISRRHPHKKAVQFGSDNLTYEALISGAEKCASAILVITKGTNEIIGLCVERSLDMIIGILGILKAGCAYLPIDPEYPMKRTTFMLNDAGVNTVLTHRNSDSLLADFNGSILFFEDLVDYSITKDLFPAVSEDDVCYVIYTSGSSGKPKGVPISHGNIINSTKGRLTFYPKNPKSFLLLSSFAFDSSKVGIFWTLCTGGTLVIGENRIEQDLAKLGAIISKQAISHTLMLPSLYALCLEHCEVADLESLETVIVAGEACSEVLAKSHFDKLPKVDLYNEYGPTEATVWSIAHHVAKEDAIGGVPIGKAVAGAEIYIMREDLGLVPYGAIGEIFIGGPALAGEYLNRPNLTDSMYVSNPYGKGSAKLYKTGDLGRYNQDGNIMFLGRRDLQVKIRGHRIELDEIEKVLLENVNIDKAVVVVDDSSNVKQLVTFFISNDILDSATLKNELKSQLPKHMIPSQFLKVDKFPTLPNGKLDTKALLNLKKVKKDSPQIEGQSATNATQAKLVKIWQEVLAVEPIGIHDNFFELGGDSMLSIQIIAKARKMDVFLSPNHLFKNQTIAEIDTNILPTVVEKSQKDHVVSGEVPLTPIQHWFFETHQTAPHFWNQAIKINGLTEFSSERLGQVTKSILHKHDALRATFSNETGEWIGNILEPMEANAFFQIDLTAVAKTSYQKKIQDQLGTIQQGVDLSKGPLFRCLYFKTGHALHDVVILWAHHLVIDFISWQIIIDEFMTGLQIKTVDNDAIIDTYRTSSIKSWAQYLKDLSKSESLQSELTFWEDQCSEMPSLPLDFKEKFPIYEKDIAVLDFKLDGTTTDLLVQEANTAYNTKVDELLIAALVETLAQWTGANEVSIALEKHGREITETAFDLSNTVGWFTAFFPMKFKTAADMDKASKIISIKERLRNIPRGGVGYGAIVYLTKLLDTNFFPQVVFNFLGKQNDTEHSIEHLTQGLRHPESERNYPLEINTWITDGNLHMKWSYGGRHFKLDTINKLIKDFEFNLKELVDHCCSNESGKFTPSDFPEADLSQNDLDALLDGLD